MARSIGRLPRLWGSLARVRLRLRSWHWALVAVALLLLAVVAGRLVFGGQGTGLAQIRANGVWRVGMDPSFPPFESLDADNRPVGFDVDLAEAIAGRWVACASNLSIWASTS